MRSDRRSFFKDVAGAAAAVAGVEAMRGARAAEAAAPLPGSAGRFALELEGEMAGFVQSAEGGHATAAVVEEAPGESCFPGKNLGQVSYEEIALECGTGMTAAFYAWLQAAFACELVRKSGSILSADFNYKEVARRDFSNALITEISFPKLDASSKDPASLTVSFAPETTRRQKGTGTEAVPEPRDEEVARLELPADHRRHRLQQGEQDRGPGRQAEGGRARARKDRVPEPGGDPGRIGGGVVLRLA
jgi:hypothetical protein